MQTELFVKIYDQTKSIYWNKFYGPSIEKMRREMKKKEKQMVKDSQPIMIKDFLNKINNQENNKKGETHGKKNRNTL